MRLTDQPGNASHPVVSPDGRWVAYYVIEPRDGNREIWMVPAQGGHPIQVTDDPATDSAPAWAPDGRRIAFCSERAGAPAIFAVPVQEGRPVGLPVRVSPAGLAAAYPCWSPDGRRVAFLGYKELDQGIFVADFPPGENLVRLTAGTGIHLVRWVPGLDEIWASADWDDRGISVRKVDQAGGGTSPLEPPLEISSGANFGWFNTDSSGRFAVLTEIRHVGDIWVIAAQEGQSF
jgi:dipeptidyl aminopeptidase/acylaminoacyl peptidase